MISDVNTKKIILWEFDKPVQQVRLLNYAGGIWQWCITPGVVTVTDDNGNTGYYGYTNNVDYNINSLTVDGVLFLKVSDLVDLETQDEAFYYDTTTKILYLTFTNYEGWTNQKILAGASYGYSVNSNSSGNYYGKDFYPEKVTSISGIKKSKDPLFYGLLKFNSGTVKLINNDATFDEWRDFELYRQPTRILAGEDGDVYASFIQIASGVVGEHSRSWNDFSIKFEDARTVLTNKLPKNTLTIAEFPYLSDSNIDNPKPLAYGVINNAKCTCLTEELSAATYTFLLADTEYNAIASLNEVQVNGVVISPTPTPNLTAGTFTLTSAQVGDEFSNVTASFTMDTSENGIELIKLLMSEYAFTDYIHEYYDLTETAAAVTACAARKCHLYLDKESDVKKEIEKLCVDTDALFFQRDNGLWTARVYDDDRVPIRQIYNYEILEKPTIEGNEDQFLSSVIIQYNKNNSADTFETYENKIYEEEVFDTYKALQSKTYETSLTDLTSAQLKSETVMEFSKFIQDIVKITVGFQHYDLEIMDFIICDPRRRRSGTDTLAIWEIIEISKDFNKFAIQLTLKYIKIYTAPPLSLYYTRSTNNNELRVMGDGSVRIIVE